MHSSMWPSLLTEWCIFHAAMKVDPEELTLVYNLKKLMKNNWVR